MTDEEMALLKLCSPEVVLQAAVPDKPDVNNHFYIAARCAEHGWLEFVRDKDFGQSVYRITPKGWEALQSAQ